MKFRSLMSLLVCMFVSIVLIGDRVDGNDDCTYHYKVTKDTKHYNYYYEFWECPKWRCKWKGYRLLREKENDLDKCQRIIERKTKERCHIHHQCRTCGKEAHKQHYYREVTVINCELCDKELDRYTTRKDEQNGICTTSHEYRTREGTQPGECCDPCNKCGLRKADSVHDQFLKKKYICCTKDVGKVKGNGSCGQTRIRTMNNYCFKCICGIGLLFTDRCVIVKGVPNILCNSSRLCLVIHVRTPGKRNITV